MPEWKSDSEMLSLIRRHLYSAVVGDICDAIGFRKQYLDAALAPIDRGGKAILAGRALTVVEQDTDTVEDEANPWGLMLEALDSLGTDEIYVCSGATGSYALFGELMATAARNRGAVGAICNGYVRDTHQLVEMGFPVFCRGTYGCDQRGRGTVTSYGGTLRIGDIDLRRGELLVGDIDGVVVVPLEAEEEVITKALAKARTESVVRIALSQGMPAAEAFRRYGVL